MRALRVLFCVTLVSFLSTSASALLLDLDNCDAFGCAGSDVSLEVTDAGSGNWNVILTLDSTGYTGSESGVVQAGFKAISGASLVSLDSFSDGTWSSAVQAGMNSSGLCSGPDSSDFVCTSGYANITTDKEYTWNFLVTGGSLLDEWTIKFQYGDLGVLNSGKLISAPGNPVPEPSAALVFAVGLVLLGARRSIRCGSLPRARPER